MPAVMLKTLVDVVLTFASENLMKTIIDGILDVIEEAVQKTGTPADDMVVLPLINQIRTVFNVPDNDNVEVKTQ
jgi:hypothetical protein